MNADIKGKGCFEITILNVVSELRNDGLEIWKKLKLVYNRLVD